MLGMLVPLGIEIGKPFAPNASRKRILKTAAAAGITEMTVPFFANPRPEKIVWEGIHCFYFLTTMLPSLRIISLGVKQQLP